MLDKFRLFKNRVTSEGELLEQELIKYVTQMEFEVKQIAEKRSDLKLDNLDIKQFRKLFAAV